jgi:titin
MKLRTLLPLLASASLLAAPLAGAGSLLGPAAPTGLVARAVAPGTIGLAWNASSSLTGVTAYRVYHVGADGNLTGIAEVPGNQTAWNETGLAPGVTMTYVVSAVDLTGEGAPSDPASATTWTAPTAPRDLAATPGPGPLGEVTLTWAAPASDGGAPLQAYRVYRDGALVATISPENLTFHDSGLLPFEGHGYQVSAVNEAGEGTPAEGCGMPSPWVGNECKEFFIGAFM